MFLITAETKALSRGNTPDCQGKALANTLKGAVSLRGVNSLTQTHQTDVPTNGHILRRKPRVRRASRPQVLVHFQAQ